MPNMNNVQLIGHLAGDVQTKVTQNDKTVSNFTLAVKDYKDTAFVDVDQWSPFEEIQNATKGALMAVEGSIKQDKWEDKQSGQKRSKLKINAKRTLFLRDKYQEGAPQSAEQEQVDTERNGDRAVDAKSEEDSIPF